MKLTENYLKLDEINNIHFIGIGGIGMSALAFKLLSQGKNVSGSDKKASSTTDKLVSNGAVVYYDHFEENVSKNTKLVVVSTAIDKSNPEVKRAQELNIPICHRSDILNYFLRTHTSIAVTGTHGKTSTSAMMAQVLYHADLDPTALIGGNMQEFGTNSIQGKSEYLVAEVDESDQSIHKLSANYAIVTNLEVDHLDHYKDLDEIISVMRKFISNLPQDATLIVCKDNFGNKKLIENCDRNVLTYSLLDDTADLKVIDFYPSKQSSRFKLAYKGTFLGEFNIPIGGTHYILNAMSVILTCLLLGLDLETIKKGVSSYKGVKRRFEVISDIDGTMIVDDYAHHPTEIRATLASASAHERLTTVVFQPHRYSRTKGLLKDFSEAFESANRVIITDIYGAGEKQEDHNVTSLDLVNLIKAKHPDKEVYCISTLDEIKDFLVKNRYKNEIILTMGAGTITNLSKMLLDEFCLAKAS
jgi:UDP-N-acetylmuramate--alanine ligase